jgi:hypothetical protein
MITHTYQYTLITLLLIVAFKGQAAVPQPLFDAHLHYNQSHYENWSIQQIIDILDSNHVQYAAITSTPPELVLELKKQAPTRIFPVLGLYQRPEDKQHWHWNPRLIKKLEANLKQYPWAAIGEIHLFAPNKKSPVFHSLIKLAKQYQLPIILHADPAVIDSLYDQFPEAKIIWAHASAYPFPELLRDYLERYPKLMIDLSMRNERIAPEGELAETWELLFFEYPDRFMVGVDTYRSERWQAFDQVSHKTRHWLNQLPEEIAQKIATKNAQHLFMKEAE